MSEDWKENNHQIQRKVAFRAWHVAKQGISKITTWRYWIKMFWQAAAAQTWRHIMTLMTAGRHLARSHSGPALFTPAHLSSQMPLAACGRAESLDSWLQMFKLPKLKMIWNLNFCLFFFHELFFDVVLWNICDILAGSVTALVTRFFVFRRLRWNWVTHQHIV